MTLAAGLKKSHDARGPSASDVAVGLERSNASNCNYNFTVYIYEFPPEQNPWLRTAHKLQAEHSRWFEQESADEQFTLELVVHRILAHSCVRTRDPKRATFFLVACPQPTTTRASPAATLLSHASTAMDHDMYT